MAKCVRCGDEDREDKSVKKVLSRNNANWCKRCDLFVSVLEANIAKRLPKEG